MGQRLLAAGRWPLAAGRWPPLGCWLLAASWLLAAGDLGWSTERGGQWQHLLLLLELLELEQGLLGLAKLSRELADLLN